jgi:toxin YoeB
MTKPTPYRLLFAKEAVKDAKRLKQAGLKKKAEKLLEILKANPYQNSPSYEKLVGRLKGTYSRRINIQHRLVYQVHEEEKIVRVLRMWTHYE